MRKTYRLLQVQRRCSELLLLNNEQMGLGPKSMDIPGAAIEGTEEHEHNGELPKEEGLHTYAKKS